MDFIDSGDNFAICGVRGWLAALIVIIIFLDAAFGIYFVANGHAVAGSAVLALWLGAAGLVAYDQWRRKMVPIWASLIIICSVIAVAVVMAFPGETL